MPTRTDLEITSSQTSVQNLATLLADTTLLYVKTRNFHWNIVDPRFISLHKLFENSICGSCRGGRRHRRKNPGSGCSGHLDL